MAKAEMVVPMMAQMFHRLGLVVAAVMLAPVRW